MGILSSKLVISVLDRASGPARAIAGSMKGMQASADRNRRELNRMQGQMLGAVGTGYILARSIAAPVKSAMEFESAMSDVKKVVDFDSPEGFKKMRKDIIDMSTRMPMTASQIADIVAAAGQAGMAGEELTQFAEMAAKVGVAFDVSAGTAGESLAKIKTALGLTVSETGELADAINHLSNTSASSAPDLLDYMRRVGSVGKQYGFTAEQTAAIGSAMIASGAQADVAATSFRNAGKALARGEGSTSRQRKAYKRLGLDAVKVSKHLQKDAVGTLKAVIGQIRELPKELQASTISDLFGDEARAIAPLIENAELLDKALGSVAEKANYLGSSQDEYNERAKTSAAQLQKFQNKLEAASIAVGSALLPALNDLMDALGPHIKSFAEWAEKNPEILSDFVTYGTAAVGVLLSIVGLRFLVKLFESTVLDSVLGIGKAVTKLSNIVKLASGAKAATSAATAAGAGTAAAGAGSVAAGKAARKGWMSRLFGGSKWLGKRALGPVGWGLMGMDAVNGTKDTVARMTRQWSPEEKDALVSDAMQKPSLAQPGKSEADVGLAELRAELAGIDARIEQINPNGPIAATLLRPLEAQRKDLADEIAEIEASMRRLSSGLEKTDSSAEKAAGALDVFSSVLRNFRIPLPKPGAGSTAPEIAGARAIGGQIVGGRNYLVGENGAELVTPSQSGYVHTASETSKMMGGGSAGSASGETHYHFGPFHMEAAGSASEMFEQFVELVEDQMSGLHADLEYAVR